MQLNTINQIIENIKSIPKLEKNKHNFFNEYSKLGIIGVIETQLNEGKYLFRSRLNKEKNTFLAQKDISYPPIPSDDFGRANCPKVNMFYCSYTPSITVEEEIVPAYMINAHEICPFLKDKISKVKKMITIGKWRIKKKIILATIIFHEKYQNKTAIAKNLNLGFNSKLQNHPQFSKQTTLWNKFISQEYAKEVEENNYSEYIISATYTEFLLNKGFDGVIYPTVQLDGMGYNIAITPSTVDTSLDLEIVVVGCFYKEGMFTILDWEKKCIVDNPKLLKYEDDPERLGPEICSKIIAKQKAKVVTGL